MSSNKITLKNVEKNITKNEAANALEREGLGDAKVLEGLENSSSVSLLVFLSKINSVTLADKESIWK